MNKTLPTGVDPVHQRVRPRYWMDDRGLVVTDKWLKSDKATSDYRAAYTTPVRRLRANGYALACEHCGGNDETPPQHTQDCSRFNAVYTAKHG